MRRLRLKVVLTVARVLRVPVDVHGSFFTLGIKLFNTSGRSTAPK